MTASGRCGSDGVGSGGTDSSVAMGSRAGWKALEALPTNSNKSGSSVLHTRIPHKILFS